MGWWLKTSPTPIFVFIQREIDESRRLVTRPTSCPICLSVPLSHLSLYAFVLSTFLCLCPIYLSVPLSYLPFVPLSYLPFCAFVLSPFRVFVLFVYFYYILSNLSLSVHLSYLSLYTLWCPICPSMPFVRSAFLYLISCPIWLSVPLSYLYICSLVRSVFLLSCLFVPSFILSLYLISCPICLYVPLSHMSICLVFIYLVQSVSLYLCSIFTLVPSLPLCPSPTYLYVCAFVPFVSPSQCPLLSSTVLCIRPTRAICSNVHVLCVCPYFCFPSHTSFFNII